MMQPHLAKKIEQATRKDFTEGISSYGTDALRFTFASLASTGRDIRFDLARTEGYRNFCNKLWNAARYVLTNTKDRDCGLEPTVNCTYTQVDRWIVSRLHEVIKVTTHAIDNYRFDLASQAIYEFVWNEYCDWYLELAKISLQSENEALQRGTRKTLLQVLEAVLRLAHPIMPFITEDIWQRVAPWAGVTGRTTTQQCDITNTVILVPMLDTVVNDTIMLQPYPIADETRIDKGAIAETQWLMQFILGVRRIRGEMNIAPSKPLPVLLQNGSLTDKNSINNNLSYLQKLARLETITWLEPDATAPESAIALLGDMSILIPMAGLIDKDAELARLDKEIQKLLKELPRIESKLANPSFVDKAPPDVIEKEQAKLADLQAMLNSLEQQQRKIQSL
jgi:valyl-tRNA synthetase